MYNLNLKRKNKSQNNLSKLENMGINILDPQSKIHDSKINPKTNYSII